MIEFFEKNIFLVVGLIAVCYIGFDLYKSKKKGELEPERMKKSLKGFKKAIEEAKFKEYVLAFGVFLLMFLFVRGFIITQNEMQECQVSLNNEMINALNSGWTFGNQPNNQIREIIENYDKNGFNKIDQNRSYNFYRRWFNKNGGRANFVNIECNFKLSYDRFIKNIRLDMLEVRTQ